MAVSREDIFQYVKERYGTIPDNPWDDEPDAAVLRKPNKKWYGLLMKVRRELAGLNGDGKVDILNVKCSSASREILIGEGKAIPAYHMNKRLWISVLLSEKVNLTEVCGVLDESYDLVKN